MRLTFLLMFLCVSFVSCFPLAEEEEVEVEVKKGSPREDVFLQDELQRIKKQASSYSSNDYSAAIHAGRFAQMLSALESQNKPIYTQFISSGFTEKEIPRHLPPPLNSLSVFSRGNAPPPLTSPLVKIPDHPAFTAVAPSHVAVKTSFFSPRSSSSFGRKPFVQSFPIGVGKSIQHSPISFGHRFHPF